MGFGEEAGRPCVVSGIAIHFIVVDSIPSFKGTNIRWIIREF